MVDIDRGSQRLHFRINTYLKDLIGRELLTNKYVAVFELVKNSYDAGASEVVVKFISSEKETDASEIAVIDNGSGMSRRDIEDKWMNVAKSYKRDELEAIGRGGLRTHKIPVGRKGIGRFSCDKLGETLHMYTRTDQDSSWNHLIADWKDFQDAPEKDFQDIPVTILEEEKPPAIAGKLVKGTVLVIGKLREKWDYESVLRLKRHFQKLLDPVTPAGSGAFNITIDAPFLLREEAVRPASESINGPVRSTLFQELGEISTRISVTLRNGILNTKLFDRGELLYTLDERVENLLYIDAIDADIFYLDEHSKGRFTRRVGIRPVKYGSIFLYRNGVRVFPYGEPDDDWLGLNARKQQGYKRYLSSRELFGRVALTDTRGIWEEASSRDSGIKDSNARNELVNLVNKKIITRLEKYIVDASDWNIPINKIEKAERNMKVIELLAGMALNDKNVVSVQYSDSLTETVRERGAFGSLESMEGLSKDLDQEKRKELARYLSNIKESLKAIESEAEEAKEEAVFLRTASQYVKTGTLRLIAEHNLNIISRRLRPALLEVGNFAASTNAPPEILREIEYAVQELELLKERNKLVMRANWNITKEEEVDIPSYIEQYVRQFWIQSLDRRGIELEIIGNGLSLKKIVHPEIISLVLDNLLDNSAKSENDAYHIRISFLGVQDGKVVFTISDDGRGVPPKEKENLFRPWRSATAGSGIGLYLMRKLLTENGGELRFVGNGIERGMKGASFEVQL